MLFQRWKSSTQLPFQFPLFTRPGIRTNFIWKVQKQQLEFLFLPWLKFKSVLFIHSSSHPSIHPFIVQSKHPQAITIRAKFPLLSNGLILRHTFLEEFWVLNRKLSSIHRWLLYFTLVASIIEFLRKRPRRWQRRTKRVISQLGERRGTGFSLPSKALNSGKVKRWTLCRGSIKAPGPCDIVEVMRNRRIYTTRADIKDDAPVSIDSTKSTSILKYYVCSL